jgi:hypothetical protein
VHEALFITLVSDSRVKTIGKLREVSPPWIK